jgi:hypothetical protein
VEYWSTQGEAYAPKADKETKVKERKERKASKEKKDAGVSWFTMPEGFSHDGSTLYVMPPGAQPYQYVYNGNGLRGYTLGAGDDCDDEDCDKACCEGKAASDADCDGEWDEMDWDEDFDEDWDEDFDEDYDEDWDEADEGEDYVLQGLPGFTPLSAQGGLLKGFKPFDVTGLEHSFKPLNAAGLGMNWTPLTIDTTGRSVSFPTVSDLTLSGGPKAGKGLLEELHALVQELAGKMNALRDDVRALRDDVRGLEPVKKDQMR